jgi:hypothetical protein
MSNVVVDIKALTAASDLVTMHNTGERDLGYKWCDCDACEANRCTIVECMPEVLRRLKTAEATDESFVTASMPKPTPMALSFMAEPLQAGDRFKYSDSAGDTTLTVVHCSQYPSSDVNGYALVNLDGSSDLIKGAHEWDEWNTYSGWGWALAGLTADIIHDETALTRLPRIPIALAA